MVSSSIDTVWLVSNLTCQVSVLLSWPGELSVNEILVLCI
jgi:hypothetical protein